MSSCSRWRPSAILNYVKFSADHPRSGNGVSGVLKFRLDRIYSFGDIAIFVLWVFGLNLPVYMVVSAAHAQNEGQSTSEVETDLIFWFMWVGLPIHHPTSNSWSFKGCLGLLTKCLMLKPILSRNFLSRLPFLRFLAKMGSKCKNLFSGPQKAHPCAKHLLTYWSSKSAQRPRR